MRDATKNTISIARIASMNDSIIFLRSAFLAFITAKNNFADFIGKIKKIDRCLINTYKVNLLYYIIL